MREFMQIVESAAATVRLSDLYSNSELRDESERIGQIGLGWDDCDTPLPVKEMSAEEAKRVLAAPGETVFDVYRHATKDQKRLVAGKVKSFENDRIIVLEGEYLIDGFHHLIAAIKANMPIRYIDLGDL